MKFERPDLRLVVPPMEYNQRNCYGVDPDVFFPVEKSKIDQERAIKAAQDICRGRVVQGECYEIAISNREKQGIWGGVYLGSGSNKPSRQRAS